VPGDVLPRLAPPPADGGAEPTTPPAPDKLLLSAEEVAGLLGFSVRHVRRLDSADQLPAPVRPGGGRAVKWRREDIEGWVAAGCPDRRTWEALRKAHAGRR
jgi:excisionase family DNA binding protein